MHSDNFSSVYIFGSKNKAEKDLFRSNIRTKKSILKDKKEDLK
jgi:hypothetical protein